VNKLLLLSVVVGLVAIPVVVAREPNAVRGLKKLFAWIVAFNVFYALALRYVLPRL
jgi:hypothetical protein